MRKGLLLGMICLMVIILCICVPLTVSKPKNEIAAEAAMPRIVSTNITSFLVSSTEQFTPVIADDGGRTECTWSKELFGDYCAFRGKRRHWQKLWCRSTGFFVGYLTHNNYEQARNVVFMMSNGDQLKPQFAGNQGLLGQTLGFFYLNDPACDNEFLPTLEIGDTNVVATTRMVTAPNGIEIIECLDCGKLRNDLGSDFCSAREFMLESHWHYDTFASSCVMHDLCLTCSGKLQVKTSQCNSWFFTESWRLCNGNSDCQTLAWTMSQGIAVRYLIDGYTADAGLNECQQYYNQGLLSRAWIDRGLSLRTIPSFWTCVTAASMQWIAIYRNSDGSAICVSGDSINCRYHETKSVCDSDKGVVTIPNFLKPAPAPKLANDASAWTCVPAANMQWIAIYRKSDGSAICVSSNAAECRYHETKSVCDGDKGVVTIPNFLNPAPAPKMAYDASAWTCVKASTDALGWMAVAYDNRFGYTHCLTNDGNNCRWHPTLEVCNGDRQIAAAFGFIINPHRERALGRMNAYWPTTSTVRLNYSFRIQNEANNRCVIQASPSAGQSLRFDDNCDSITTTNLITYSFDNGRLKLVDGKFICPENQTVGSKLRTYINDCEARWEFLPTGNLRHVQTGFCVHPISGGAPASGEEMVIWNDCSATRTPLLYRLAASLS